MFPPGLGWRRARRFAAGEGKGLWSLVLGLVSGGLRLVLGLIFGGFKFGLGFGFWFLWGLRSRKTLKPTLPNL